ncbi:DUF1516 family protein [Exiguobacterium qingdaonense]|uniref:DUF1516 family protein n=1 Tax=Exiguobacterium qingdaonense TaxID=2751251 RepID=UPI001BEB45E6
MFQTLYSIHASVWLLLIISFFATYLFTNRKIIKVIFRTFALLMLSTGISMLYLMSFPLTFSVKGVLAVILVASMEILIARKVRHQNTIFIWFIFGFTLVLILLLGFNVISL